MAYGKSDRVRMQELEARCERIEAMVSRVVRGLEWLMDREYEPIPADTPSFPSTVPPRKKKAKQMAEDELIDRRPESYAKGRNARVQGELRGSNPYPHPAAGYQRAWYLGWDDADAGVDRTP